MNGLCGLCGLFGFGNFFGLLFTVNQFEQFFYGKFFDWLLAFAFGSDYLVAARHVVFPVAIFIHCNWRLVLGENFGDLVCNSGLGEGV